MIIGVGLRGVVIAEAKKRLAANLLKIRTSRGLSQRELAERVGVSPSQVSHWENGDTPVFVGADNLSKLADALDVDVSDLFAEPTGKPAAQTAAVKPSKADVQREAKRLIRAILATIK